MKKKILFIICIILLTCCSCENHTSIDNPIKISNDIYYKYVEDNKELLISSTEKEGYEKSSFDKIYNLYIIYDYNVRRIVFEENEEKFYPKSLNKVFCATLEEIDGFENIDTSYVEDFTMCFSCCSCLNDNILRILKTDSGKTFKQMFGNCDSIKSFDFSKYNFLNAVCLDDMFFGCYNLEEVNLNDCDFSNVTSMETMFSGCQSLKKVDFSDSNFSKCENINGLFADCTSLCDVSFENSIFNNVKYMSCMFICCDSIETIDLSSFDLSNLIECVDTKGSGEFIDMRQFGYCMYSPKLKNIFFPKTFDASFIERDRFYEGCDFLEAIYYKDDNNIELIKTFKE